jgi:hypothetical protein
MLSLKADVFEQMKKLFQNRIRVIRHGQRRFQVVELDNRVHVAVYICGTSPPLISGEPRWRLRMRSKERDLPALICLPDRELTRLTAFYFVWDQRSVNTLNEVLRRSHPWLAESNCVRSLADLCRVATRELQRNPSAPLRTEAFSVEGDVLFTKNDPTVIIDGNEIRLSVPAATVFKLLLQRPEKLVPRKILLQALETNREDPELYLNFYVGDLRKLLGHYGDRIVTVKGKGYMYHKALQGSVI